MDKKKLVINTSICDARNASENVLDQHEGIAINTAIMLVSEEAKELLAKHDVNINAAEILEVSKEAEVIVENGSYELDAGTLFNKKVVLIVNGSLCLKKDVSSDTMDRIEKIFVNGSFEYPDTLAGKMPSIKVNGSIVTYPGDCVRLKNRFVLDKSFILRAKDSRYYAADSVIITDETLNIDALQKKGVSFITGRAVIAEKIFEAASSLFDEKADIKMIPEGYVYMQGCTLTDALISKYGGRIWVDGDLKINNESGNALHDLESAVIEGSIITGRVYENVILSKDIRYSDIRFVREKVLEDKGIIKVDMRMLNKYEDGITIIDCGVVNIDEEITPDVLEDKLEIIGCGLVNCSPEQSGSVELISRDCGKIDSSGKTTSGDIKDLIAGMGFFDKNIKVVNANHYCM